MNEDLRMERENILREMSGEPIGTEAHEIMARSYKALSDVEIAERQLDLLEEKNEIDREKMRQEKRSRILQFLGKIAVGLIMVLFGWIAETQKEKGVSLKSNEIWTATKDAVRRL